MDDPEHARYRKMIIGDFTVRSTEAQRPLVEKLVNDLLDAMERGPQPVDLVDAFALPLPSMVICHMLGVPYGDHDFFQAQSRALLDTTTAAETSTRANDELRAYLTDLIARKEAEPADDILGRLAQRYVLTGKLSRYDAVSMALLLLVAGHETTANMISLGTLTLLQHPEQAAEVRDGDAAVVKSAVEELLRWLSVVHTGRRRIALEDIEVGGVTIRAGEAIIAAGESANRDSVGVRVSGRARHPPRHEPPHRLRFRCAPVPRPTPGPAGAADRLPGAASALPRPSSRGPAGGHPLPRQDGRLRSAGTSGELVTT